MPYHIKLNFMKLLLHKGILSILSYFTDKIIYKNPMVYLQNFKQVE